MEKLLVVIYLMLGAVILVGVGERLRLPWPVLMVGLGAVIAFLPSIPVEFRLDTDVLLALFLPPLLFASAQRTSWSVFRAHWHTIVVLAIALVVVTVAATATTALLLLPGLPLAAAIALGAMIAPPDPVAVESVAQQVSIPRRVLRALQSEGLFNDAAALVIFQLAVAATVAQHQISGLRLVAEFLLGAAGAVLLGLGMAWAGQALLDRIGNSDRRSALILILPFAVYTAAEQINASGVIAVVVLALQLRKYESMTQAAERLAQRSFWDVVELLVMGLAFGLIGLEIRDVVERTRGEIGAMLTLAAIVVAVMVVVRALWLVGLWLVLRSRRASDAAPRTGKEALLLTWCGMRGLATLVLALSLPRTLKNGEPFPAREEMIVIACTVLAVTLCFAGLTLPTLIRVLGITGDSVAEAQAEQALTQRAYHAAWQAVQDHHEKEPLPEHVLATMREILGRIESSISGDLRTEDERQQITETRHHLLKVRALHTVALNAACAEMIAARKEPGIDPEVADRVLHHLDLRTVVRD